MAKIESTKMTVSLDNDSKRVIRNLTKAIDNLARIQRHAGRVEPGSPEDSRTKRLVEIADDPALSDDNENHSQEEKPKYARGGFVNVQYTEPAGSIDPKFGPRVDLDANAVNALHAAVGKYNALG